MSAIDVKEKTCKQCSHTKPTVEFYQQQQHGSDGQVWRYYDTICIECRKHYGIERRRAIKLEAVIYKGGKCVDCGYDDLGHPEVFDFHHTDPSKKDFSPFATAKAFKTMKPELDKCVLLCANCHRIRHATEN